MSVGLAAIITIKLVILFCPCCAGVRVKLGKLKELRHLPYNCLAGSYSKTLPKDSEAVPYVYVGDLNVAPAPNVE